MTAKERQDAMVELRDMAQELEQHSFDSRNPSPKNRDRAAMLRAVSRELSYLNDGRWPAVNP